MLILNLILMRGGRNRRTELTEAEMDDVFGKRWACTTSGSLSRCAATGKTDTPWSAPCRAASTTPSFPFSTKQRCPATTPASSTSSQ
ncbi:MAG: hypothetical protein WKG07_27905 [Hymenobacter sp.]